MAHAPPRVGMCAYSNTGRRAPGTRAEVQQRPLDHRLPALPHDQSVLRACNDPLVECQICEALNAAAALQRDCDLFDNGSADSSCP